MSISSETNTLGGGTQETSKSADMVRNVKDTARRMADQQKESGAERIGGVAGAIHSAADELQQKKMPVAASYVHDAADRIDNAAARLRDQSLDDLLATINGFARDQPVVFFGGALVAGFALSRFIKSASMNR